MKKGPEEDYREYVVRWKNVASLVRPALTNREENSIFVDTLPSPYYDMLVVNAFVEFGDLMYSMGRIEDGIRREKKWKQGQIWRKRKELFSISMFKQCLGKEETKEDHIWHGMSPSRIILVHHYIPKSPWPIFIRPKGLHGNVVKSLIQAIPKAIKEKRPKCTIYSQWPTESYSLY